MASRRFFGYDPYDYYYTAPPNSYPFPYYYRQQHPAPARAAGGFLPVTEPAAVRPRPAANASAVSPKPRARTVAIPVHFVGSDPEPAPVSKKRAPSAEDAAVRLQAAARGFQARRAVHTLRAVEREAEHVAGKVAREAEALRGDAKARIAVGESLMRLLLRLDAVRGAREYRRRVTKRVLALQDAVDALEPGRLAPAEEHVSEVTEVTTYDVAEVNDASPAEMAAEMDVDGDRGDGEKCAAEETEQAQDGANHGDAYGKWEMVTGEPAPSSEAEPPRQETEQTLDGANHGDADGEWEMVMEEPAPASEAEASAEQPRQEPAGEIRKAEASGGANLDAKKVMDMVAALCERSAQQCAVIGALAERVDALERAVRRVEDSERRRRRAKKLKKEGRGSNQNKCYID